METIARLLIVAFLFVFLAVAFGLFGGLVIWLAWNHAVVPLFHAPHATFFQAWFLGVLVSLVGNAFRSATASSKKE